MRQFRFSPALPPTPVFTVGDGLVLLKARGVPAAERHERALALIDTVGLDGFELAYPREISGGMRQKVGFARRWR